MNIRGDVFGVCGICLEDRVIARSRNPIFIKIDPSTRLEIRGSVNVQSKTSRALIICIPVSGDGALHLTLVLAMTNYTPTSLPSALFIVSKNTPV